MIQARKQVFRAWASDDTAVRGRFSVSGAALVAGCLLALLPSWPVSAQMQLPGAVGGEASTSPPKEAGVYAPPKPIIIKPPSEETIAGQTLKHDGLKGAMTFERTGSDLSLTKLKLTGDKISSPNLSCNVDIALASPIVARPAGRPVGALRFDVPLPVCPFVMDVLDGAVLVSPTQPQCEITAADCRVAPTGLWGPAGSEITPERAKSMERDRVRLETTMRTNFRVLLRKAGKDRTKVKAIARDQAAFSSDREITCRDYDQESAIGFCSTQITQARALALIAQFGDTGGDKGDDPKPRPRKKPKPALSAPSGAPAPEAAAPQGPASATR